MASNERMADEALVFTMACTNNGITLTGDMTAQALNGGTGFKFDGLISGPEDAAADLALAMTVTGERRGGCEP